MRAKAKGVVKSKSAILLIVLPARAAFSQLQSFSAKGMGAEKIKDALEHGVKHFGFAVELQSRI